MPVRNKYLISLFLSLISLQLSAQTDSLIRFSFNDFLKTVKYYHPVARQAGLIINNADNNTLAARGLFDPKFYYQFENKYFKETDYYKLSNGGFKIPTWYGVDFNIGYENSGGNFLNAQNVLPANGLYFAQVSLPLLQGLIIDDRRATLRKALLFRDMAEFERLKILNELLANAGKTYYDWQLSYSNLQVYLSAKNIAQERFYAVRRSFELGDRPAIDTVESLILLQERIVSLQNAELDYRVKSYLMSGYLWIENNIPVELTGKTIPETELPVPYELRNEVNMDRSMIDSMLNMHPELRVYDFKLKQYEVEQKLKQDKLKPNLSLKYNPLYDADNVILGSFNNYEWGLSLAFPLFLRKERGELRKTRVEMESIRMETFYKRNNLANAIKARMAEAESLSGQFGNYLDAVGNYEKLWLSEKKLFSLGESSLFMINTREMNYINARLKLNDIYIKGRKSILELKYAMGQIATLY